MKIEDLRPLYVVHTFAVLTLLSTVALFGYEVTKPDRATKLRQNEAPKVSALASPTASAELVYQLPRLPERFEHKVLVHRIYDRQGPSRRKYTEKPRFRKSYLMAGSGGVAEVSGIQ